MSNPQPPKNPSIPKSTVRVQGNAGFANIRIRVCDIRVLEGPQKGRVFRLDKSALTIGNDPDNDVVLADSALSRHHAIIEDNGQGYTIQDLGSTNGTYVDGIRIERAFLEPGSQVAIGRSIVSVEPRQSTLKIPPWPEVRFHNLIGHSLVMRRLFGQLAVFASSGLSIILHGETGTGKEMIASAIHLQSKRSTHPFGILDCAATDPNLFSSALFGHTRGAFTGASSSRRGIFLASNHGTVFLDEIGELPLEVQPKLLRVLEQRAIEPVGGDGYVPVDVRIVSATHRDLSKLVADGRFRQDLLYRLQGVQLHVPSLRERNEDIIPLAEGFLAAQRPDMRFSDEAKELLKSHAWPGNVRQLKNTVERSVVIAAGEVVDVSGLMMDPAEIGGNHTEPLQELPRMERKAIEEALKATGGHRERAARMLGISSRTLREKIKKYGVIW